MIRRNKEATVGKIVSNIFFALILGAIYSQTSYNQKSIQDRIGVLFFFAINQTFGNLFAVLNSYTNEKVVVERERASKSYHVSAYYLGKFCAELPFNTIGPLLFGVIVYWIIGFNPNPINFFIFLGILLLSGFCAIALGLIVGGLAPNVETANAIAPIIVVLMILFGGFYINVESLPVWLRWVEYLSLMQWSFKAMCINEFATTTFTCDDVSPGQPCITDGSTVLERLSFDDSTVVGCVIALVVFLAVMHVIAYMILRCKKRRYQKLSTKKVD